MAMSHFMAAVRNIVEISLTDTPKSYKNNHKNLKSCLISYKLSFLLQSQSFSPFSSCGLCFALPANKDNKNAEIIIKAIENNSTVDTDKLVNALSKHGKTPQQLLHLRLLRGCIFTFIGIAMAICIAIKSYSLPETHLRYSSMMFSGIFLAIGIAYLVVYFVTRNVKANED